MRNWYHDEYSLNIFKPENRPSDLKFCDQTLGDCWDSLEQKM